MCGLKPEDVKDDNIPLARKEKCKDAFPSDANQIWRESECKNSSFEPELDARWANGFYLAQCFGHNLTFNGLEQPCQHYVFKLSAKSNFSIGNRNNIYYSKKLARIEGLRDEWVSMISVRLPPFFPLYKWQFAEIEDYEIPVLIRRASKYVPSGMQTILFWVIAIVMILIVIYVYYSWCRKMKYRLTRRANNVAHLVKQSRRPYVVNVLTRTQRYDDQLLPLSLVELQRLKNSQSALIYQIIEINHVILSSKWKIPSAACIIVEGFRDQFMGLI